jgi:hypothetical protein
VKGQLNGKASTKARAKTPTVSTSRGKTSASKLPNARVDARPNLSSSKPARSKRSTNSSADTGKGQSHSSRKAEAKPPKAVQYSRHTRTANKKPDLARATGPLEPQVAATADDLDASVTRLKRAASRTTLKDAGYTKDNDPTIDLGQDDDQPWLGPIAVGVALVLVTLVVSGDWKSATVVAIAYVGGIVVGVGRK